MVAVLHDIPITVCLLTHRLICMYEVDYIHCTMFCCCCICFSGYVLRHHHRDVFK